MSCLTSLKFEGDKQFFTAALDRADLILHGRNSYEDQPNSPRRKRLILTRKVRAITPDPSNPNATLWNPTGASFETACAQVDVRAGTVAVIGGPYVFGMFMDRYDVFWLSQAPRVRLPDGEPCFPGVPARSPQHVLASHGLRAGQRANARPGGRRHRHAVAARRLNTVRLDVVGRFRHSAARGRSPRS